MHGEFVCVATTLQERFFSQLFQLAHDTDSGRKIDLMLLVDGLEALNSEAKPSKDRTPCERQFLKNLRINHAIHIVTAKRGVHLPRMNPLDIRGMSAMICGLQAQGDIFLGGAACEDVVDLPTSKDELASFLSGPSAKLLWNYTKLLLEYQDGIKEQLRKKRSASITEPESPLWQAEAQEDDEQSEARTPPQMPKLYALSD
ncbi:hypothetical protein BGZ97_001223 [Linnemannia gamsii]|uniref:Uncharacterized protein n=1 Tax=Linnemannia gamsii TaxID=64522 RepID=A0A9P6QZA5_9FUNG|nr:hypothetical protein BGZ97_001223 [Linnemannia gamsii]